MSVSDPAVHLQAPELTGNFSGRTARGGAVTISTQILKVVLQLGATAVLARLLRPEAFGLIAMVAVVVMVLEMFKDLGLSAATVQRERISHREVSTLFWVNVALGVVAAALMLPLAPLLAWFYREPALLGITMGFGVAFALSGLSTQHLALLRRQMRFSVLAGIQMGAEIAGMLAAVVAAWWGADYWALVIQRIVWALCLAIGSWIACAWRPGPPAELSSVRELLWFGGNITGSNLITTLVRSLDQILIGWYWGAYPLGLYDRAYKILLLPINNLNAPLFTVAMPTLSRLSHDPVAYRRVYLGMVEKLNMVVMPCAALLIAMPDQIVRALFGSQWLGATPIVGWLGLATLYQPITYTCSWLFMTQDRTGEMLHWGVIGSILSAIAIVAGLPFGAAGVAASFAIGGLVIRQPWLFWMVGRRGPVSAWDLARSMIPSTFAAAMVVGVIWAMRQSPDFTALALPQSIGIAVASAAFIATACFVSLPQSRQALREFIQLGQTIVGRRANA